MALIYRGVQKNRTEEGSLWDILAQSRLFAWTAYTLALTTICFVTLYPLPANMHPTEWSNLHNSLFISLSRPLFVIALMLLMVCMLLDHGRWVKTFFSARIWVPLSRLSYVVYLVVPIVNSVLISSMN